MEDVEDVDYMEDIERKKVYLQVMVVWKKYCDKTLYSCWVTITLSFHWPPYCSLYMGLSTVLSARIDLGHLAEWDVMILHWMEQAVSLIPRISHSSLHRYPQDTVTSLNNWDEPINYPSSTFSVSLIPRPPARLHLTAVEKNKDWSAPEPWTVYICYGHDLVLPVVVNEDVDTSLR